MIVGKKNKNDNIITAIIFRIVRVKMAHVDDTTEKSKILEIPSEITDSPMISGGKAKNNQPPIKSHQGNLP